MQRSSAPQDSFWDEDLTVNPKGKYKFSSLEVGLNLDLNVTNRQSYNFLEWLGDIGGLADALFIISEVLLSGYSTY